MISIVTRRRIITMVNTVILRDGKKVAFDTSRIIAAILKAMEASNSEVNITLCESIASMIQAREEQELTVTQIQKFVENFLMDCCKDTARKYIVYRAVRDAERDTDSNKIKTFNEIIDIADTNIKNDNANMNGNTPAGQMMKFASQTTNKYADDYLVNPMFIQMHKKGYIHIHDKDYYPTKTTTCVQYPLNKLFKGGFDTGHGFLREPNSIRSAAALAAIAFQTNQNEQHGGQSIPAFDYFMAPYVRKSFIRYYKKNFKRSYGKECTLSNEEITIGNGNLLYEAYTAAYEDTKEETEQAMEAFVANMNSMHSRGGNQVVFSSNNWGTDTSDEARMVMFALLKATEKGLGKGETPVFPIQIFKVKDGLNFSEEDFELAINNIDDALSNKLTYKTKNFDLFVQSCVVSSKRLFPNFAFLDAPFNVNPAWKEDDEDRFKYEIAYMGCRTRVFTNRHGETSTWGRGNISFTTLNLVRLAIEAKQEAKKYYETEIKINGYEKMRQNVEAFAIQMYFNSLGSILEIVSKQLYERYKFQCTAKAKQFPFLVGQGIWMDGENLKPDERVEDLLKHGSLSIGYIGLAEALKMLVGEHHGESDRAQEVGLEVVGFIREACDKFAEVYDLNFSCIATPAEGLSGRFTTIDKAEFGVIPGVTDREYYTNSNHIPVYYSTTAYEKIQKEAPYHALTNAGHICYVEMDAEAKKNIVAFMKLIKAMKDAGVGYGSINHPVDRCTICAHEGVIETACPNCGETEMIDRIRRITGYLTGTLDRWNSFKKAEERDRTKHGC
jgi:anaerobic ribonucleoside-triphosphate reductase